VNRLHIEEQPALSQIAALNIETNPVNWAHEAKVAAYLCSFEQRQTLTHSALASEGQVYIQGLSSMLAAILLQPSSDDWVLDLAAAPGGKTILLAELMNNRGKISAVEPVKSRFFRLNANLERTGVTNTKTYMKDGRAVGKLKPECFDKVLLDAPCSSESRFRTNDASSSQHWNLRKVAECAKKQKRLILSGFDALKPGGKMLYSTCSYSPEENELVVSHLLKKRQNAELLPIKLDIANSTAGLSQWRGKGLANCEHSKRIWPTSEMDGFYLALLTKH